MEGATERVGFRKDKELEREQLAPIKNEWGGVGATCVWSALPPPTSSLQLPIVCMYVASRSWSRSVSRSH